MALVCAILRIKMACIEHLKKKYKRTRFIYIVVQIENMDSWVSIFDIRQCKHNELMQNIYDTV